MLQRADLSPVSVRMYMQPVVVYDITAKLPCMARLFVTLMTWTLFQFLGVWYPIMRLRGSSTPDSAVVRYEITGLGQLMYTVTGQINRSHMLHSRLPTEVHE